MGSHVCEYCNNETSRGDVTLSFTNGNTWIMPDMILHYIADHGYKPELNFIDDVSHCALLSATRLQTKGITKKIGYLSGEFQKGRIEKSRFFMRLWSLMRKAEKTRK